jgi:hypothetical protein
MTPLQKLVSRAVAILQEGLRDAQEEKRDRVREFLQSETEESEGQKTVVVDLRRRFFKWLPCEERAAWTRKKFCSALREHKALKEGTANKLYALDTTLKLPEAE